MASVTYRHVTKRFGDFAAVNDLDIDIQDKEFLVFVGPSGCGKTTSLRLLAGLEDVSEGELYIGDRKVNEVAPKDRNIAMVFQSYALYPHLNVYDNVGFGLRLRKADPAEIDKRVRAVADQLDIGKLLRRKPAQLSGGQRQRVALGRAIVRNPDVFLMDEPLSNLDAKLRVQTRAELVRLHHRLSNTIIYVTHDQVEAMTMGSRIAVMNAGQLQQVDTPHNIYNLPNNKFVARFVGNPSMNFFDARLSGSDEEVFVEGSGFRLQVPANRTAGLQQNLGREVTLGIRPEDIYLSDRLPKDITGELVQARVDVVELVGNEILLYLILGKASCIARVDPRSDVHTGQSVQLLLNMENIHLFDKESEQALR